MTNPDPRGGVPYTVGEKVLYTEANLIRSGIVNSIDGSAGGSYSPSTAVTIAGSNGLIIGGTGSAARLRYVSRDIQRVIPQPAYSRDTTNWAAADDTALPWFATLTSTSGHRLWWPLHTLPNGATLSELVLRFKGATGGTVPATAPKMTLYKHPTDGSAPSTVFATVTDPTVAISNAAYVVDHDISKTGIAHTIDLRTYSYWLVIESPGGGGTSTTAYAKSVLVTCTITDQSEWNT